MMNPLARDPEILATLRDRVKRRDWPAARRLALAMQLHRLTPQAIFEQDDTYLKRLVKTHARNGRPRPKRLVRSTT